MNGSSILIDTNIFIYLTKGDEKIVDFLQDKDISLSYISELELLSFKGITAEEEKIIEEIIAQFNVLNFRSLYKEKTVFLRKKYNLKLPDSIILAIALHNKLPFFTSDKKLKNIEEIDVIIYEP